MTEQEYLRNIAILNKEPTLPPLPEEIEAEIRSYGKLDDDIARTVESNRLKELKAIQERLKLTDKEVEDLTERLRENFKERWKEQYKEDWDEEVYPLKLSDIWKINDILELNYDYCAAKQELIQKLAEEKVDNRDLTPGRIVVTKPVVWIPQKELDQYKYDPTSKSFVKVEPASDLQNAYNKKLTDEEIAKHYNSFQPEPNYHVELATPGEETTWSKVKRWFKSLF